MTEQNSSRGFRDAAREQTNGIIYMMESLLLDGTREGYRYDDATARKIMSLAGQLRALVEGGGIVKDQIPESLSGSALAADAPHAIEQAKSSPQCGGNVVPFRQ